MFKKQKAIKRHGQLMRAAGELVGVTGTAVAQPADLQALVFGRHQLEVDARQARRYLAAARVARGKRLTDTETPDADDGPTLTAVKSAR